MDWSMERVAQLQLLWGEGLSAQMIADRLGTTRNAVIGKANRLGLEGRRPAVPRVPYIRRKKARPCMPTIPAHVVPLQPRRPRVRPKPLIDLGNSECRWPADLPHRLTYFPAFNRWQATTHFCAAPTREGEQYCPFHKYHAHPQRRQA